MEDTKSWKEYATHEELKTVAEIESNPNPSKEDLELVNFIKEKAQNPGPSDSKLFKLDVKATNLFVLSSITICRPTTLDKLDVVELYGRISLIDDNDDEFFVFCHERNCVQVFSFDSSNLLKLSVRDFKLNRPHLLPIHFWVKLYLKDRYKDIRIFKGKFKLDFTGNIVFDKEQCVSFETEYGVVSFQYTILKFGVLAMVECKIGKNEGPSLRVHRPHPRVKGIISAMVDRKVTEDEDFSHILFDKDCVVPSKLDPLDEQSWFSPWFAVPAYASLKIVANLDIDGEKIKNFVEFEAYSQAEFEQIIPGSKWHIWVKVSWKHAGDFRPINEIFGTDSEGPCGEKHLYFSETEDDITSDVSYRMQELNFQRNTIYTENLVEVFSIVVHHFVDNDDNSEDHIMKKKKIDETNGHLLLSGEIESRDVMGNYDMFKRDETFPALLESHGALSIVHPSHCHLGPLFGMIFDLKDSVGHEISKGFINLNDQHAYSWYDKRVCSVITGDFGFAAVHYTFFQEAFQANVGIRVKCSGQPFSSQVFGRIYAQYDYYRYFTSYEKENYQSMLFEKRKVEESVILNDNEHVPLSKVAVAVPLDGSLIIIADLRIRVCGMIEEYILRGKATFQPECDVEQEICGTSSTSCPLACLGVSVRWVRGGH